MTIGSWFKRIFGGGEASEEAAEQEEYKLPDRGEADLRADGPGYFTDGTRAVADDLDEFKAPRDPNP